MTMQPLACQFCGAALSVPAGQDRLKCDYCGAELTVLVAERIEVRQESHIPEAILLAEPLPASPATAPPAPERAPAERASSAKPESLDIPPWASRLVFRAIREIFRRR